MRSIEINSVFSIRVWLVPVWPPFSVCAFSFRLPFCLDLLHASWPWLLYLFRPFLHAPSIAVWTFSLCPSFGSLPFAVDSHHLSPDVKKNENIFWSSISIRNKAILYLATYLLSSRFVECLFPCDIFLHFFGFVDFTLWHQLVDLLFLLFQFLYQQLWIFDGLYTMAKYSKKE